MNTEVLVSFLISLFVCFLDLYPGVGLLGHMVGLVLVVGEGNGTPVLLPGEFHGRRSLVGCSPWGHWAQLSDFPFTFHFHALEKDNPLQCSCLENPRDGGAWWAAVYGVAQSWTRPKRLSSSSNFSCAFLNNLCIYDCAGSRCYAGFTPVVMSGVWLECEGLSVCWLHVVEQDRSWALAVAVAAAPEP